MTAHIVDEVVARIAPIEEQDTAARNVRQQDFDLFALVGFGHGPDGPGDRQAAEDIVDGGDRKSGIVALAGLIEPAVGVERRA